MLVWQQYHYSRHHPLQPRQIVAENKAAVCPPTHSSLTISPQLALPSMTTAGSVEASNSCSRPSITLLVSMGLLPSPHQCQQRGTLKLWRNNNNNSAATPPPPAVHQQHRPPPDSAREQGTTPRSNTRVSHAMPKITSSPAHMDGDEESQSSPGSLKPIAHQRSCRAQWASAAREVVGDSIHSFIHSYHPC
jgi:hypothetical protein